MAVSSTPPPEPDQQHQSAEAGVPRFGRLLLVLIAAVLLIVAITFGSEAYFS